MPPAKHNAAIDETSVTVEDGVAALDVGGVLLDKLVVKNGTAINQFLLLEFRTHFAEQNKLPGAGSFKARAHLREPLHADNQPSCCPVLLDKLFQWRF